MADKWGAVRSRLGSYRMRSIVEPGLYGLGAPGIDSPVFASANYKLSFDVLRRALAGTSCWILVLDTKGINVWCAAGKGTFGTEELVERIQKSRLDEVVRHRAIVLPQLGAPGVQAHVVEKQTGFRVRFGPIRAADIPAYLAAGFKATPEMRRARFPLRDRLVLTPMELGQSLMRYPIFALAALRPRWRRAPRGDLRGGMGGGVAASPAGPWLGPVRLLPRSRACFRSFPCGPSAPRAGSSERR